jgi:hypothetical protein
MTTLTIKRRIIFKSTTVPEPKDHEYNRWISTGHAHGGPEYSIQRFTYKCKPTSRTSYELVPPYYRVYHYGFLVTNKDYPTFEKAAARADKHYIAGDLL